MFSKDVCFRLFVVLGIALGIFATYERKVEDDDKIRFGGEVSVAQEVSKLAFTPCDVVYREKLLPAFNQIDPRQFGYATIPHTWNEGLAEVTREKGAPIQTAEYYPQGSDKSNAVAVVVRRERPDQSAGRTDVHVFALLNPRLCGYLVLRDTRFRESITPAVYFVYQYWLYSDGRTEKM